MEKNCIWFSYTGGVIGLALQEALQVEKEAKQLANLALSFSEDHSAFAAKEAYKNALSYLFHEKGYCDPCYNVYGRSALWN